MPLQGTTTYERLNNSRQFRFWYGEAASMPRSAITAGFPVT